MHEALYNPEFGYYTTRIRDVGREGDFSTFATLGDHLANFIANWISQHPHRDLVEIGPGNGALAEKILKRLGWWSRWKHRYHLVDVSGPLRAACEKRLRGFRVQFHTSVSEALHTAKGHALLFSNELPDAFPPRVFEKTLEGWRELHIRIEPGRIEEVLVECDLPDSCVFQVPHPVGQRVEVHESYRRWLESWAREWRSGSLLTIDYGNLLPDLYHRRPCGTLRGYSRHQRLEGREIYQSPGRIDLTADVNFSDLENWGTALGWKTTRHTSLDQLLPADIDRPTREAASSFRVLEQRPE